MVEKGEKRYDYQKKRIWLYKRGDITIKKRSTRNSFLKILE